MPRFYFDTDNGGSAIRDDEGIECENLEAAVDEAAKVLPDMARDVLPDGDRRAFVVTVRDESGKAVYRFTLSLLGERL